MFKYIVLLFLSCHVYAATPADNLSELLNTMHSLSAAFTQTVKDADGKVLQAAQGQFNLQRPGKFRWEVLQPNPQLIIANQAKIWIYDPDLEQVTIKKLSSAAGQTPAVLLSNNTLNLEKDFTVRLAANPSQIAGTKTFILIPKDKNNMLEQIKIEFISQYLHAMQLKDHLGHLTILQFNAVKLNTPLAPTLFVFHAPSHIDVIDESKNP